MPVTIDWPEIAARLALTVLAGTVLGINRSERGMAAGLRTTLLVSLAAAVSMIQVNLLLGTAGRPTDSLVMLDLMRLPLGILTGMGFIGAGAILRQGDRITGLTTAATLWLATALGLCFGGGQHGLGLVALGLGVVILWAVKRLEAGLPQERRATLTLRVGDGGPTDDEIRAGLVAAGYRVTAWDATYTRTAGHAHRTIRTEVHWSAGTTDVGVPECVRRLIERPGVRAVRWRA